MAVTVLGELRAWMRESQPGDTHTIHEQSIRDMTTEQVEQFNQELPTINSKFVTRTLTSDARGYVFTRTDAGDAIFDGNSDARLDPDAKVSRFRPRYRKLSDPELDLMGRIKSAASALESLYDEIPGKARYVALAHTALEESVMWAVKDLTK